MKEVIFTGSLSEVHKQADEWKAANSGANVIYTGPPMRIDHRDGEDIYEKNDWTITINFDDQSSN